MRINLSSLAQFGMWSLIVVLAFVMQVAPFLLILTMINIAFGISSAAALILIPAMLFAMLIAACTIAARRRRWLPRQTGPAHPDVALRHTPVCLLPFVKRQRIY